MYTGAREFEIKGDYLFIVKEDKDKPEHKRFFLAKTGERFVEAKFSTNLDPLDFHVSQVITKVIAKLNLILRNIMFRIEGQQRRTDPGGCQSRGQPVQPVHQRPGQPPPGRVLALPGEHHVLQGTASCTVCTISCILVI